jgi:hypothetical protein
MQLRYGNDTAEGSTDDFLHMSKRCRCQADLSTDEADRAYWLELAEMWLKAAANGQAEEQG